jgi:hypothetical protein
MARPLTARVDTYQAGITPAPPHTSTRRARKAGGDGSLEAIRVLKRRLSDVVYRALLTDANAALPLAALQRSK